MDSQEAHIQSEQKALQVSMWGAFLFVILEFVTALATKSQAVLMDSACDMAETVTIFVSLHLVPLLYKPLTEKRPFGYSPVETWFIVLKGFMLVALSVGLVVSNLQIMLQGGREINFTVVAYFELFVAVVSCFVIAWLKRKNRKLESPLVTVEISGWVIDTVSSMGMAVGFFIPVFIHTPLIASLIPYIDQLIAICLVAVILPAPVKMVLSGMRDLFLIAPEQEVVDQIKQISDEVMAKYRFQETFSDATYDIVRMGRRFWVSIYVTPKQDEISIRNWSKVQEEIENALIKEFNDAYVELLPEIE